MTRKNDELTKNQERSERKANLVFILLRSPNSMLYAWELSFRISSYNLKKTHRL